ncbi:MAG TPA: DUF72 domain-containing protein [Baekduia sp.]|uniref:DUF72 domain-containing protein n=1 Tax=Baekduia sp. TaxID=2600305 RepID=UPI002D76E94A|nr:DUF72 domain-containing protein [Baekduia sp.]HET6505782.1 DUF72 domain-containing protein [Baekduia sp.]
MSPIVVGTSSWADPGFVEEWYPPGLPERERLPWYAERFEAVEVNSTFYAVPSPATVRRWARATPEDFTFDVKLHQSLSRHSATVDHLPKDLRDRVDTTPRGRVRPSADLDRELAKRYKKAVKPLVDAGKLSSFLLQLTPAFKPGAHDLDELDTLMAELAPHPVAIELRHRGWLDDDRREETLEWFADHAAAFVAVDAPHGAPPTMLPALDAVTRDDLAYLRAHGRNARGWVKGRGVAERFAYRYDDAELEEIGRRAEGLAEEADTVRVMFNNNRGDDAPVAAARMRELLGQEVHAS